MSFFAELAETVDCFEIEEEKDVWEVRALYLQAPDSDAIALSLAVLARSFALPFIPEPQFSYLQERDWVSEVQKQFIPIHAGKFFIFAKHYKAEPPTAAIALCIDPGRAFGTGTHPTTRGCLNAFQLLAKKRVFHHMLDVGTGSGILAIAAQKYFPHASMIASDIDPIAVKVAKENARINRAIAVDFLTARGYRHWRIRKFAPYDLIFCNILAKPLIMLAPELKAHLQPGGFAILSGLLVSQARAVIAAHQAQGLIFDTILKEGDWATLILHRR